SGARSAASMVALFPSWSGGGWAAASAPWATKSRSSAVSWSCLRLRIRYLTTPGATDGGLPESSQSKPRECLGKSARSGLNGGRRLLVAHPRRPEHCDPTGHAVAGLVARHHDTALLQQR